jgi:hypothetical protein
VPTGGGGGTVEGCDVALVRRADVDDDSTALDGAGGGEAVGGVIVALVGSGADVARVPVRRAFAVVFDAAADAESAPLSAIIDPPQPATPAMRTTPAPAATNPMRLSDF